MTFDLLTDVEAKHDGAASVLSDVLGVLKSRRWHYGAKGE